MAICYVWIVRGSNSGEGSIMLPSYHTRPARPVVPLTSSTVNTGYLSWRWRGRYLNLNTHPHRASRLRMSGGSLLFPLSALMTFMTTHLPTILRVIFISMEKKSQGIFFPTVILRNVKSGRQRKRSLIIMKPLFKNAISCSD